MNKLKRKNGITLIALIITIVVLLILAVVTINAVQDRGIIQHAKNSTNEYNQGKDKETSILDGYLAKVEEKEWKDNGNGTFTHYATGTTVTIGDYVDYREGSHTHTPDTTKGAGTSGQTGNSTTKITISTSPITTSEEDLKWRVLGVNKEGKLELISDNPAPDNAKLYLANEEGYIHAEDNLNNYCNALYGQGTNDKGKQVAEKGRSLNVEDINKISHYDPKEDNSYKDKYEKIWKYKPPHTTGGKVESLEPGQTTWNTSSYTTFRFPNKTSAITDAVDVQDTYYSYSISSNITAADGLTSSKATEVANMITKGTGSSNLTQWLASRCVACFSSNAYFAVRYVDSGAVSRISLFSSHEYFYCRGYRVRPVVTLKSGVLVEKNETANSATNPWGLK